MPTSKGRLIVQRFVVRDGRGAKEDGRKSQAEDGLLVPRETLLLRFWLRSWLQREYRCRSVRIDMTLPGTGR